MRGLDCFLCVFNSLDHSGFVLLVFLKFSYRHFGGVEPVTPPPLNTALIGTSILISMAYFKYFSRSILPSVQTDKHVDR